jgi:hypothetical protein
MQMQAEHVCLSVAFDGAQLDAGHDPHAKLPAGVLRLRNASDAVVIGECDGDELGLLRGPDDIGWRARPIGRRRMHVQVDEELGRRPRRYGHGV